MARILAVWLLVPSPSSKASGRHDESKVKAREAASTLERSMAGVAMKALKKPQLPTGPPLSSHSSGSAMATLPTPLVNWLRFWSPATRTQKALLAKLQPSHSRTPAVGPQVEQVEVGETQVLKRHSKVGMPHPVHVQPAGGLWVKAGALPLQATVTRGSPDSWFRTAESKFSL